MKKIVGIIMLLALMVTSAYAQNDDYTMQLNFAADDIELSRSWFAEGRVHVIMTEDTVIVKYEITKGREKNYFDLMNTVATITTIKTMMKSKIDMEFIDNNGFVVGKHVFSDGVDWYILLNENDKRSKFYYVRDINILLEQLEKMNMILLKYLYENSNS